MSRNAIEGNAAQVLLAEANCKSALETHYGKEIATITVIPGNKKADNLVTFVDGTTRRLQNKNGYNARGHHIHREDITTFECSDMFRQLYRSVCLKSNEPLCVVPLDDRFVDYCLLGTEPEFVPDDITHTHIENGKIVSLYICEMSKFVSFLKQTMFRETRVAKTQVYPGDYLVVKRHGASKTDKRPDDIQVQLKMDKLVLMPMFKVLFKRANETINHVDDDAVSQVE